MTRRIAGGLIALPVIFAVTIVSANWEPKPAAASPVARKITALESRVERLESRPPVILVTEGRRPKREFDPLPGVRK